jgi:hypothetical protein
MKVFFAGGLETPVKNKTKPRDYSGNFLILSAARLTLIYTSGKVYNVRFSNISPELSLLRANVTSSEI